MCIFPGQALAARSRRARSDPSWRACLHRDYTGRPGDITLQDKVRAETLSSADRKIRNALRTRARASVRVLAKPSQELPHGCDGPLLKPSSFFDLFVGRQERGIGRRAVLIGVAESLLQQC